MRSNAECVETAIRTINSIIIIIKKVLQDKIRVNKTKIPWINELTI